MDAKIYFYNLPIDINTGNIFLGNIDKYKINSLTGFTSEKNKDANNPVKASISNIDSMNIKLNFNHKYINFNYVRIDTLENWFFDKKITYWKINNIGLMFGINKYSINLEIDSFRTYLTEFNLMMNNTYLNIERAHIKMYDSNNEFKVDAKHLILNWNEFNLENLKHQKRVFKSIDYFDKYAKENFNKYQRDLMHPVMGYTGHHVGVNQRSMYPWLVIPAQIYDKKKTTIKDWFAVGNYWDNYKFLWTLGSDAEKAIVTHYGSNVLGFIYSFTPLKTPNPKKQETGSTVIYDLFVKANYIFSNEKLPISLLKKIGILKKISKLELIGILIEFPWMWIFIELNLISIKRDKMFEFNSYEKLNKFSWDLIENLDKNGVNLILKTNDYISPDRKYNLMTGRAIAIDAEGVFKLENKNTLKAQLETIDIKDKYNKVNTGLNTAGGLISLIGGAVAIAAAPFTGGASIAAGGALVAATGIGKIGSTQSNYFKDKESVRNERELIKAQLEDSKNKKAEIIDGSPFLVGIKDQHKDLGGINYEFIYPPLSFMKKIIYYTNKNGFEINNFINWNDIFNTYEKWNFIKTIESIQILKSSNIPNPIIKKISQILDEGVRFINSDFDNFSLDLINHENKSV